MPLWKDSNKFTEKQRQRDVARGREVNELAAKLAAKYNGPVRKQSDVSTKPTAIPDPPLLCPKQCRRIFLNFTQEPTYVSRSLAMITFPFQTRYFLCEETRIIIDLLRIRYSTLQANRRQQVTVSRTSAGLTVTPDFQYPHQTRHVLHGRCLPRALWSLGG